MSKSKQINRLLGIVLIFSIISTVTTSIPTYAAPPSSLDQVNVYFFGHEVNDARSRRLIQTMQPDMIHRGIFEWIGTDFSDKNWAGAVSSIQELRNNGSFVMGGLSGRWWQPGRESGPATVDQATINACTIAGFIPQLDIRNQTALDQLIYKAKKQIDAGVDGIEFDEYGDQLDYTQYESYIKSSFAYIRDELKYYAQNTYGKTIYLSANANFGGSGTIDGTESVDYYIRKMPYSLVSDGQDTKSYDHFDGTVNYISELRTVHSTAWPKRVFYWADFYGKEFYTAPHRDEEWANWYRISSAQILASGGFPGHFRGYYGTLDCFDRGIFQYVANEAKFIKDNSELWHNLTFITPSVYVSESNIYTSAFGQTGRTILHMVNGNYNNTTQTMNSKTNITVAIDLSIAPTNIWMTTPDKPSNIRKSNLSYSYSNGVATITVPEIDVHNVIVIEQGSSYNPSYGELEVKFPFPIPAQIPIGNQQKIVAVATDGFDGTFNWFVNNVAGGNSTVGTIDSNGVYTAPATVPSPDTLTIKAVSKVDTAKSNQVGIQVVQRQAIPWSDDFSTDTVGNIPIKWNIVDGRGDWNVDLDSDTKVLHNYNITEGNGDGNNREIALYNAFIANGDQEWGNYSYSIDAKPTISPVNLYGAAKGSFLGLVFRYQDSLNYYTYTINYDNKARLYKTVNGTITEIGNAVDVSFIPTNQYTNLKVEAYGDNFRFYVDSILAREDKEATISSGGIGIKASFVDAMYKNISVTSANSFTSKTNRYFDDTCSSFSYVNDKSSNVAIDTSNSTYLYNDSSRFYRSNGSLGQEYVTYNISGKSSAVFTSYFWSGEAIVHYKFYLSDDMVSWREVLPTTTITTGTLPNWHRVIYDLDNLPPSARFVKIIWQNTTTSWTPQLGDSYFSDAGTNTIVDQCADSTDYSYIFDRSYDIAVDTANSNYLGDDAQRYCRTRGSIGEEYLTYAFTDITSAEFETYFWPDEAISHFEFYISGDNENWTQVNPNIITTQGTMPYWYKVVYGINNLSNEGVNYIKVVWQNTGGQSWSPQIGKVSVTARKNQNLTIDPGFEAENDSEFWKLPSCFTITSNDKYIGGNSLKLVTEASNGYAFQSVSVKPNTDYILSFYAKCEAQTYFKILTGDDSELASSQTSANNEWTRYTLSFNSGSNFSIKVYVGDNVPNNGKILYFDEFEIR